MNLIQTSRPRFWMYTLGPLLLVLAVLWQDAILTRDFPSLSDALLALLFFVMFSFPANLLIYGVNDLADNDTDQHNDKKNGYEHRVRNRFSLLLFVVIFAFFLLNSVGIVSLFIQPLALVPLGLFFVTAIFYSAPPVRAKALPFVDGVFNILYILPAVTFFVVMADGSELSWYAVAAGWLWCIAMHCYSAIPDIQPDKKAGLTTTAVLLGKNMSLVYCGILRSLASVLLIPILGRYILGWSILYLVMLACAHRWGVFRVYRYFPVINTVLGFALFWYIVFIV